MTKPKTKDYLEAARKSMETVYQPGASSKPNPSSAVAYALIAVAETLRNIEKILTKATS